MQAFDVVIIGAGASGLFCAINAGKLGKSVLVLDHANKAGKKILMSGGGRCNFTNWQVSPKNFVGQNPQFVRSALAKFHPEDFLTYVYRHGIEFCEKDNGQLFCTHSSKDILAMLLAECQDANARILLSTSVMTITHAQDGFELDTAKGRFFGANLVIATGGLSIPTLGASGFGYQIANQFGHGIVPTVAALVPFVFTDHIGELAKRLSGLSLDVIAYNDRASFALPMLFTHRGLSGPAMLQLSNYWQVGQSIHINMLPHTDATTLLLTAKKSHPKQLIRTVLAPYFAKKLLSALETYFWSEVADTELANIKDRMLADIGGRLTNWEIKPSGTEGYRTAEVTQGGVDTKDISSKSFESMLVPRLFFIGEVLDVTGQLGGYNFHWAWASAFACAYHLH